MSPDFAIRQSDLAWGRVRTRRAVTPIPNKFPVVRELLRLRAAKWFVPTDTRDRAVALARRAMAEGRSPAWALGLGYTAMEPRAEYINRSQT